VEIAFENGLPEFKTQFKKMQLYLQRLLKKGEMLRMPGVPPGNAPASGLLFPGRGRKNL